MPIPGNWIQEQMDDLTVVWLPSVNKYLLLQEPAWIVFQALTANRELTAISLLLQQTYDLPETEALRFIQDVSLLVETHGGSPDTEPGPGPVILHEMDTPSVNGNIDKSWTANHRTAGMADSAKVETGSCRFYGIGTRTIMVRFPDSFLEGLIHPLLQHHELTGINPGMFAVLESDLLPRGHGLAGIQPDNPVTQEADPLLPPPAGTALNPGDHTVRESGFLPRDHGLGGIQPDNPVTQEADPLLPPPAGTALKPGDHTVRESGFLPRGHGLAGIQPDNPVTQEADPLLPPPAGTALNPGVLTVREPDLLPGDHGLAGIEPCEPLMQESDYLLQSRRWTEIPESLEDGRRSTAGYGMGRAAFEFTLTPAGYSLFHNREMVFENLDLASLTGKFYLRLMSEISGIAPNGWMTVCHASAVTDGKHSLLVAGPSGTGKSTLTGLLVASGLTFVTDDFAALDAATCSAWPFPGALSVKQGAMEVLAPLYDGLHQREVYTHLKHDREIRFLPLHDGRDFSELVYPARLLLFPEYRPGAGCSMVKLRPSESLRLFMEQSWISGEPAHAARFLSWFKNLGCYRIVYSGNVAAVGQITALLAALRCKSEIRTKD